MPLVRIDLIEGRSPDSLSTIAQSIHQALVDCFNVPRRDRFQILTQHDPAHLIYDPAYLAGQRTDGFVLIQVFLSAGRTTAQKQAFYARVATLLQQNAGVPPDDVTIVLIENQREDWSFGRGVAQYLVLPQSEWK